MIIKVWDCQSTPTAEFKQVASVLVKLDPYDQIDQLEETLVDDDIIFMDYDADPKGVEKAIKRIRTSGHGVFIFLCANSLSAKKLAKHQSGKFAADIYLKTPMTNAFFTAVLESSFDYEPTKPSRVLNLVESPALKSEAREFRGQEFTGEVEMQSEDRPEPTSIGLDPDLSGEFQVEEIDESSEPVKNETTQDAFELSLEDSGSELSLDSLEQTSEQPQELTSEEDSEVVKDELQLSDQAKEISQQIQQKYDQAYSEERQSAQILQDIAQQEEEELNQAPDEFEISDPIQEQELDVAGDDLGLSFEENEDVKNNDEIAEFTDDDLFGSLEHLTREMDVSSLLSDEPIAELDEKEASMAHDPDKDSELPLDNLDELSLDESAPVETAPVEDQGLDLAVDDSVSLDLGNDEPAESLDVSSDLDLGDGDDLVLQEDAPEAFAVEEEMDLGEVPEVDLALGADSGEEVMEVSNDLELPDTELDTDSISASADEEILEDDLLFGAEESESLSDDESLDLGGDELSLDAELEVEDEELDLSFGAESVEEEADLSFEVSESLHEEESLENPDSFEHVTDSELTFSAGEDEQVDDLLAMPEEVPQDFTKSESFRAKLNEIDEMLKMDEQQPTIDETSDNNLPADPFEATGEIKQELINKLKRPESKGQTQVKTVVQSIPETRPEPSLVLNQAEADLEEDLDLSVDQDEIVTNVTPAPEQNQVSETASSNISMDIIHEQRQVTRLRDSELERLGETINALRQDRDDLMAKLQDYERKESDEKRELITLRAELDEKKIELNLLRKRAGTQMEELKYQLEILNEKKALLEEKNKQYEHEIERLNKKVRIDISKVKNYEKELENKLELLRADSQVQIRNRDQKILELKRKIDTMQFDMETILAKEKESISNNYHIEEKFGKVIGVLKGVLEELEDDSHMARALREVKKTLDI